MKFWKRSAVVAAFLVSLPFRLLRRRPRAPVRRILVIKFLGLGSVLLATPMVRRLRALYPDAHIAFLTFDTNAELVGPTRPFAFRNIPVGRAAR